MNIAHWKFKAHTLWMHNAFKTADSGGLAAAEVPAHQVAVAPAARRPRPLITQDTAFFWDAARRHRLAIQRCSQCHVLRHPPMPVCSRCHSLEWDSVEACGRGVLLSFTVVHGPLVPPFERPYAVGLVALEEGTRLVAMLDGLAPEQWTSGRAVRVSFLDCEGDFTVPLVRPLENVA
jgi:uncharacterized OB-fold protein